MNLSILLILFAIDFILAKSDLFGTPERFFPVRDQVIKATLTNEKTKESYAIEQYVVASQNFVRSNVKNGSGHDMFAVVYFQSDNTRFWISGGSCSAFKSLEVGSLETTIFLAGPYLLSYPEALNCFTVYRKVASKRGYPIFTSKTKDCYSPDQFTIQWLFTESANSPFTVDYAAQKPFQISFRSSSSAGMIMDFYSWEPLDKANIPLMIPAGSGCKTSQSKHYYPRILGNVRFTTRTINKNEKSVVFSEVFVNAYSFSRVNSLSDKSASIFDHWLGVEYDFVRKQGKMQCEIHPLRPNSVQFITKFLKSETFTSKIINGTEDPVFLGETLCPTNAIKPCYLWEIWSHNFEQDGVVYDKYVLTIYESEDKNGNHKSQGVLERIEQRGYQFTKEKNRGTILKNTLFKRQDILNFGPASFEEGFESEYQINDCYDGPVLRKTFDFLLSPTKNDNFSFERISEGIKKGLMISLSSVYGLSSTRIADIELSLDETDITASITFLEKPPIEKTFTSQRVQVSPTIFNNGFLTSLSECMRISSNSRKRNLLFCRNELNPGLCMLLDSKNEIFSNSSFDRNCFLYSTNADDPGAWANEVSLNDINNLLFEFKKERKSFWVPEAHQFFDFQAIVLRPNTDKKQGQIQDIRLDEALDPNHQSAVKLKDSLTECLRKCRTSEIAPCNMFSYCESDSECVLSSFGNMEEAPKITRNNCTVYSLSPLTFFQKKEEGRYGLLNPINNLKLVRSDRSLCADRCLRYTDCRGFAYCRDDQSIWCDFYNFSSSNKFHADNFSCAFYESNSGSLFNKTGTQLVSDTFSTYKGIEYTQCADICHNSKDVPCNSFNFCSDTALKECQLSSKTVAQTKGKVTNRNCYNYESINPQPVPTKGPESIASSTGFTVTVVFYAISLGLLLGFVAMMIYSSRSIWRRYQDNSSSLSWSRQNDEE